MSIRGFFLAVVVATTTMSTTASAQHDTALCCYGVAGNPVPAIGAASSLYTDVNGALASLTTPRTGPVVVAGCTVGTSSAQCLAAATATNSLLIENTSASATIACSPVGATAALNSSASLQLLPGQSMLWGPSTSGVPAGALTCVASAASSPLFLEYN